MCGKTDYNLHLIFSCKFSNDTVKSSNTNKPTEKNNKDKPSQILFDQTICRELFSTLAGFKHLFQHKLFSYIKNIAIKDTETSDLMGYRIMSNDDVIRSKIRHILGKIDK